MTRPRYHSIASAIAPLPLLLTCLSPLAAQAPEPSQTDPAEAALKGPEIIQLLGARQEDGVDQATLQAYSQHFDRVDRNQDGFHSPDEYIENAGYKTRASRSGIFQAADRNRDGRVSKNEYLLNRIITDEAKALISAMDANQDGQVTRSEFIQNASLPNQHVAARVFSALDRAASGSLSPRHYLPLWGQWARQDKTDADARIAALQARFEQVATDRPIDPVQPPRPPAGPRMGPPSGQRPSPKELMSRFDDNQDGRLTGQEIPDRMRAHLERIDQNGDGEVSWEELKPMGPPRAHQKAPPHSSQAPPQANRTAAPRQARVAENKKQLFQRQKHLQRIDLNQDGFMARAEYLAHGPASLFDELDRNRDGRLSSLESRGMMTFEPIPAGNLVMGSESAPKEAPPHPVALSPFSMGTTEVTTAQYCQYLNAALQAGEVCVTLSDASGSGIRIFVPIPAYEVRGTDKSPFPNKSFILLSPVAGLSHIQLDDYPINIPEHPLNQSWLDYAPETGKFFVRPGFEDWPVVNVRWFGAKAFAHHYGLKLPSEAQWEYAAQGGNVWE